MSDLQSGAERMPHDLSPLGFPAGQIGRLITISTTPVIAGASFELDAVGALRLSRFGGGLAGAAPGDVCSVYVSHRPDSGRPCACFLRPGPWRSEAGSRLRMRHALRSPERPAH